jgi:hypothetical protein
MSAKRIFKLIGVCFFSPSHHRRHRRRVGGGSTTTVVAGNRYGEMICVISLECRALILEIAFFNKANQSGGTNA